MMSSVGASGQRPADPPELLAVRRFGSTDAGQGVADHVKGEQPLEAGPAASHPPPGKESGPAEPGQAPAQPVARRDHPVKQ